MCDNACAWNLEHVELEEKLKNAAVIWVLRLLPRAFSVVQTFPAGRRERGQHKLALFKSAGYHLFEQEDPCISLVM